MTTGLLVHSHSLSMTIASVHFSVNPAYLSRRLLYDCETCSHVRNFEFSCRCLQVQLLHGHLSAVQLNLIVPVRPYAATRRWERGMGFNIKTRLIPTSVLHEQIYHPRDRIGQGSLHHARNSTCKCFCPSSFWAGLQRPTHQEDFA